MKQFHCPRLRDTAYSWAEVKDRFPQSAEVLNDLAVGSMAYDVDGDVWMRLPDLGEAPVVVTDQAARDERLERIATAMAKALIAELDKQA